MSNENNPFSPPASWSIENVLENRAIMIARVASREPKNINGTSLITDGGRPFTFGPDYDQLLRAWQLFVAETRGKSSVVSIQYGTVTNYTGTGGKSSRTHTLRPPMDQAHAIWIKQRLNSRDQDTAFFFSTHLLLDFLAEADHCDMAIHRDCVFTTGELMPAAAEPRIHESFADWCHFMRSWLGGLTYWRCKEGTLHTCDNVMACCTSPESGEFLVTDFLNESSRYYEYPSGDIGIISDNPQQCQCGQWHFGFSHNACTASAVIGPDGKRTLLFPTRSQLPVGWQAIQFRPGELVILCRHGWTMPGMEVARSILPNQFKLEFARGWFRKQSKMPESASLLVTDKHRVAWHADRTYQPRSYVQMPQHDSNQDTNCGESK